MSNFTADKQQLYIEFALQDAELFSRVQHLFDPQYFDRSLQKTVKFIQEFVAQYKQLPKASTIKVETGVELEKHTLSPADIDWFYNDFEQFAKSKALTKAILESADMLESNNFSVIEKIIKDAVGVGLVRDIGLDYYDDPARRLRELLSRDKTTPTGWKDLDDKLFGGFNRGELNIFTASSGMGKSLVLQNLATNWSLAGLNGVYITLELSTALCAKRVDSMMTGVSSRELLKRIDEVDLLVKRLSKTNGSLKFVYLPAQSQVAEVKSVLKEIVTRTERPIDFIIVDYLDLLMPSTVKVSTDNTFGKDKYVSEELRNLAIEFNALLATASQLNRSAVEAESFDHSHIAGGISKINTADNVLGILSTEKMRDNGEIQFQFMKTRNSSGFGSAINLSFNKDTMRITDGSGTVTSQAVNAQKILNTTKNNKRITQPAVTISANDQLTKLQSILNSQKEKKDLV